MTVAQLIEKLREMPGEAVVLLEGDGAYARIARVDLEKSVMAGLPDEVILSTDAEE
jgi:ABC-type sugar transport system substrate-binding protein